MLPSHILTDRGIGSPAWGVWYHKEEYGTCPSWLSSNTYILALKNPNNLRQDHINWVWTPATSFISNRGRSRFWYCLFPAVLHHLGSKQQADSQHFCRDPSGVSSFLSTGLTRHHRIIFLGGTCISLVDLPVYITHTRTEKLQGLWENQQDGKGRSLLVLWPPTPSRLDSRNQGKKRKDWSPKDLVNSHTQRTWQGEKWKRMQWRGEKKRKKFIVT